MHTKKMHSAIIILVSLALVIAVSLTSYATDMQNNNPEMPPPNFTVAFIGDSGWEAGFEAVLNLMKDEGVDLVLHQGDLAYSSNASGFFGKIDTILGTDFPYLASIGNHDTGSWPSNCGRANGCYANFLTARMAANGIVPDDPDLDDEKYAVTYQGLRIVFIGQNGNLEEFAQFLNDQLPVDDKAWKICSMHRTQKELQVGDKSSQMGWDVFHNCFNVGAIVATAHEHSYSRTRTLINPETQTVDAVCPDADAVCLDNGKSFVFVSGLGGEEGRIDAQSRCLPTTFPYGCNQEWASIYTSSQGANFGALFITFHVDGDPYKARGYFKDIDGVVADEFTITLNSNEPPATATPTATATATPTATVDPTEYPWHILFPFIR
ncbi:MAG: metallophosphoesterase [Candidatus Promineifilaceae bacterium]|nr:metallophosphoesterase [Candidatus Promineifilaceae bacterium]